MESGKAPRVGPNANLVSVGYLGWDEVVIGDKSLGRSLGGALWHFMAGYLVLGGSVRPVTWGTREIRDLARSAAGHANVDWSSFVVGARDARFQMTYSACAPGQLETIVSEVPYEFIPSVTLQALEDMPLHLCTMRWTAILRILSNPALRSRAVSIQLHRATLPTREGWERVAGRISRVFLNENEFRGFTGRSIRLVRNQDDLSSCFQQIEWVVTAPDGAWYVGGNVAESIFSSPEDSFIDATGAGDIFAGAFSAVAGTVSPRCGLQLGGAFSRLSLYSRGSESIWELLNRR